MSEKSRRSFSLDPSVHNRLQARDDVNWSGVVNSFLAHYTTGEQSKEAALAVELEQVEQEIAELRADITRKQERRQEIEEALDDVRQTKRERFAEFEAFLEEQREQGTDVGTLLEPGHPAAKTHAGEIDTSQFLNEFMDWAELKHGRE